MYGHHFTTTYYNTSGPANLVGRKFPFSLEAGLNVDYILKKNLFFRTGIASHLHFISEISYGVSGPYPPLFDQGYNRFKKYGRGTDRVELGSAGIPLKIGYELPNRSKYLFFISAGPMVNFYTKTTNHTAGQQWQNLSGGFTRVYFTDRIYNNNKNGRGIRTGISYPQLEFDADITVKGKFKRIGLIGLGLKGHLGSKRLENTTYVIWPTEPGYKSTGHFRLNRSYIGLFGSYTFGRNQK